MFIRTVENVMKQFGVDRETAQRYCDLREEGYPQWQARIIAGISDPHEDSDERN